MTTGGEKPRLRQRRTGIIIRDRRKELGMSSEVLADAVAVSQSHISRWESGKRVPSDMVIQRVVQKLELDFEEVRVLAEKERYSKERDRLTRKYRGSGLVFFEGGVYAGGDGGTETDDLLERAKTAITFSTAPTLIDAPTGPPSEAIKEAIDSGAAAVKVDPSHTSGPYSVFSLNVRPDMAVPGIDEGDIIVVDVGKEQRSGKLVLASIRGNTEVRRFRRSGDLVFLESTDQFRGPVIMTAGDKDNRIIGVIIHVVKNGNG
jgi:SOS-response transcriptional repressor LexA